MRLKNIIQMSFILLLCAAFTKADKGKLPSVMVKNLNGAQVNTSSFSNDKKPIILSFWATWCKPCKKELDAIAEKYNDWQKETGVKLIAVSIDEAQNFSKVVNDVKAKGWDYEVYIDESQNFKKAMNVSSIPSTFVLNGNGKIVWSHNSYSAGDEDILYENVKKALSAEDSKH